MVPKVVISGYYGFGNAGDEAMLTAIIGALRRHGDYEFVVLSGDPERSASEHGVRGVGRTDLPAIYRELRGAEALISGGGSLLQDVTSQFTVPYYLGLIYLAKALGRKVVVYGQGIGPLYSTGARWLTRTILNRCDLITVRDDASANELDRLGVKRPPIHVTADPVLSLARSGARDGQMILREAQAPADGPLIGLSPREWLGRADYKAVLAKAADHLAEQTGAKIVLIPMQHPEDWRVCRQIREQMRRPAAVLERHYGVEELLAVYSRLDLVIGMRLHALIFAALAGTPMVGLSYDPKVDAFLRTLGQEPVGTTEDLRLSEVISRLDRAWADRVASGEEIRERLRGLRERAEDSAVLTSRVIIGRASSGGVRDD